MDAAFEQLTNRETGSTTPPVSEAAVMRAVRDEVLRRSAAARRQRGPDPVQPARGPMPQADLPDAAAGPLAAFLAEVGDTDERVLVPAELATAMLAALPPLPAPTALPSRTAAARERAFATLGRAAFLRGELASNNLDTVEPLLRTALDNAGFASGNASDPLLLEIAMRAAMEGYRAEASGMMASRAAPAAVVQTASGPTTSSPQVAPTPAVPRVETPLRSVAAAATLLSPDTAISVAFTAFRKAKKVDRAWQASAERDAETTIRMFTEFFGDLPLREVTRELLRQFRSNLSEICSDWGQAADYADPSDPRGNRRVAASEVLRVSRGRPPTVKRLSTKTINKNTSALSGLWKWAEAEAGCEGLPNPTQGMQKKLKGADRRRAAKNAREAFRVSEIQQVFTSVAWNSWSPLHDGSGSALRPTGQASRYFGLLLGAYMGMREREIVQLRVGDVEVLDDGLVLIHVRPLADADYAAEIGISRHRRAETENTLKTLAADRVVPVHPVVLGRGFLQYLRLRGGAGGDFLFLDITSTEKGARNLSRSFLELRRELGIVRPKLDFHSLRHSARTMLAGLQASRDDLDLIFGHENASDREHVREVYQKGNWHRPLAETLARLTYGVAPFGEEVGVVEQMRRDGFVLCR
ncbi:tyrosine-type recombinase/integrase [Pararoseomonas sp. SCSIO 73927]|uniref:tyrosine-type recombinase/integrase n=1 Tax=Pararoseomonas sp. SCSIO 73927 TaxID=3114537 RepID=UPI0030D3B0F5